MSGTELAKLYDLVVFPGHEEYVTTRTWNAIQQYRNLGGNLAFLSANDFFYRVDPRGTRIYRTGRWSDVGRSDAALIGGGYVGWFDNTYKNEPYVVTGARSAPWLFHGTGLANGSSFGSYGIEINQCDPGVASAHARARPGEEPVRPGPFGPDDLLPDPGRRQGLLSRGDQLRRVGRVPGRLTAPRQPLAAAQHSVRRRGRRATLRRPRGRPT